MKIARPFCDLKVHHLARAGAVLTLGLIIVGARFGRVIERSFSGFVPYIPVIGGLVFALILIGAISWFGKSILHHKPPFARNKLYKSIFFSVLILGFGIGCSASLVTVSIEWMHVFKYKMLSFFLFYSIEKKSEIFCWIFSFATAGCVGALEEFSQYFIPERVSEFRDLALNVVAAFFGACYALVLVRWWVSGLRVKGS